jgi:peptide/nickel transport system substrate-binding protein
MASLAFFACTPHGAVNGGTEVRVALVGFPAGLTPLVDHDAAASSIEMALFRSFVRWNQHGFAEAEWAQAAPNIENKEFTLQGPDQASYRFTLRDDAKWSDGKPLTTEDFLFCYRMAVHPLWRKQQEFWVNYVRGMHLSDPRNIVLDVNRSNVHDVVDIPALPAHLLDAAATKDPGHFLELPYHKEPIGDGPFKLVSRTNSSYTLAKNPLYTPRPVQIDKLSFLAYQTVDDALNALRDNNVDVLEHLTPDQARAITAQNIKGVRLESTAGTQLVAVMFNCRLIKGKDVRHTLAAALDRGALVTRFGPLNAVPTESWYQPLRRNYTAAFESVKPPAKGAPPPVLPPMFLRAYGTGSKTGLSVIFPSDRPNMKQTAEWLAEAWSELGLHISVEGHDSDSFAYMLHHGNYGAAIGEFDNYPWTDPALYFAKDSIPTTKNSYHGENVAGFTNARLQQLLKNINRAPEPTSAGLDFLELQKLLASEVPVLPLYYRAQLTAWRTGLEGLAPRGYGEVTWNVEDWVWKR